MTIKPVFVPQDTAGLIAQDNVSTVHDMSNVHDGSHGASTPCMYSKEAVVASNLVHC